MQRTRGPGRRGSVSGGLDVEELGGAKGREERQVSWGDEHLPATRIWGSCQLQRVLGAPERAGSPAVSSVFKLRTTDSSEVVVLSLSSW